MTVRECMIKMASSIKNKENKERKLQRMQSYLGLFRSPEYIA